MTQFENVWSRIQATAKNLASSKQTPSPRQAKDIVQQIIWEEHAETPPVDALEYLADELRSLVGHYTGDGKRSTHGVTY